MRGGGKEGGGGVGGFKSYHTFPGKITTVDSTSIEWD